MIQLTISVIISLFFVTSPAVAEWSKVTESIQTQYFVDFDTLKIEGKLRKFWQLNNLKQRDIDGELSQRLMVEINCHSHQARTLAESRHSGPMATGVMLSIVQIDNKKWFDVPPGTIAMVILNKVCAFNSGLAGNTAAIRYFV